MDQVPVPVPPVHGDGTAWRHSKDWVTSPSRGRPRLARSSRRCHVADREAQLGAGGGRRRSGFAAPALTISCPVVLAVEPAMGDGQHPQARERDRAAAVPEPALLQVRLQRLRERRTDEWNGASASSSAGSATARRCSPHCRPRQFRLARLMTASTASTTSETRPHTSIPGRGRMRCGTPRPPTTNRPAATRA